MQERGKCPSLLLFCVSGLAMCSESTISFIQAHLLVKNETLGTSKCQEHLPTQRWKEE
jgi:hypothetical protein